MDVRPQRHRAPGRGMIVAVVALAVTLLQSAAALPPSLVPIAPADGQTDVVIPVNLQVQVTDPDGDPLTVTFHVRPVNAATADPDFTIIGLPDTQYYCLAYPEMFYAQTQWIVDSHAERNIVFVSHYGDLVQHGDNNGDPTEWIVADTAISTLETVLPPDGLPYGLNVGNHDQSPYNDPDGTTDFFNEYFGVDRFQGRAYYGGHHGDNNDSNYQLFSAGSLDFVVVNLEFDETPDQPVLDWAHDILTTHADRRAIVVTHWLMGSGNPGAFSTQGQAIHDALKDRPNLFLMMGGHIGGTGRRQDTYQGNTVHSFLANYQNDENGGNAWLRVLEFSPACNEIRVRTYSPYLDQWSTRTANNFTLPYDMDSAPWQVLGTVTGVASGDVASLQWTDLDPFTGYEWRVVVCDGTETTIGPAWRFTTGEGGTAVASSPVTRLLPGYPNPFNPRTTVAFELARPEPVQVMIYGLDGRLIRALVNEALAAGRHDVVWTGTDDHGCPVASGTYLLRMSTPSLTESSRVMLVR